jgi:hypothetical protein
LNSPRTLRIFELPWGHQKQAFPNKANCSSYTKPASPVFNSLDWLMQAFLPFQVQQFSLETKSNDS